MTDRAVPLGNFRENLEIKSEKNQLIGIIKMQKDPFVYLFENFYISSKKNSVFQVSLVDKGIILKKESNGQSIKEQTIPLKFIIGSKVLRRSRRKKQTCSNNLRVVDENSENLDESDVSAYLYVYAYILKKQRHERTTITLRFRSFDKYEDNNREAQKWRTAIKCLLNDEKNIQPYYVPKDHRKILVLVNPKSGQGKARELFQLRVVPIFQEAEIAYDLYITKKANFARDFVRTRDITTWRSIVVVGGDGIYFEVINGIFEREDWQQVIDETKIGIIPCGSGNGLAKTISYSYGETCNPKPILSAALAVVKEKSTFMDLVRIETCKEIMFSFLSVGWGLIADIDIESERLRAIGSQRFTVWSIHRLISLRTYMGKVSYLPVLVPSSQRNSSYAITSNISTLKHSVSYNTALDCNCHGHGDCDACDVEFGDVLSLETVHERDGCVRPRFDSWYSTTSRKSAYFSTRESIYQSTGDRESLNENSEYSTRRQTFGPNSRLPSLATALPNTNWVHLPEKEFVMVHAAYQSHLGSDCYFAPKSKLNDGIIWLLIIKSGVSRSQLLYFLLGLSNGTHLPTTESQYIQMIPCSAFRIEPDMTQSGNMVIDGEKIDYGPIQGEIFPGIAKIMIPNNN